MFFSFLGIVLFHAYYWLRTLCEWSSKEYLVLDRRAVTAAAATRFGVCAEGGLLMARGLTLCVLVMSLVFYCVFWDGVGTWKEEWAGKLD